jgi:hypothetical protein
MKVIIYVLCHDDDTERQAREQWEHFSWARVYRMKRKTELFDAEMYRSDLMEMADQWEDADYVGTVSHRAFRKFPEQREYLLWTINNLEGKFVGLIKPFTRPAYHDDFMKTTFEHMLSRVGLKPSSKWYFCNYWCCPPSVMKGYIHWFNEKWLPVLASTDGLWDNAKHNTPYKPSEASLILHTGRPYYTYHCFLCERVVSPFFDDYLVFHDQTQKALEGFTSLH